MGGKKGGLGAQKVRADFDEIERDAEMQDQILLEQNSKKEPEVKRSTEEVAAAKREEVRPRRFCFVNMKKSERFCLSAGLI